MFFEIFWNFFIFSVFFYHFWQFLDVFGFLWILNPFWIFLFFFGFLDFFWIFLTFWKFFGFLDFKIFFEIFWIFLDFVVFLLLLLMLLLKVTKVITGDQKSPKMGQNSIKSSFFARRAIKASAKGRSPPQELEVGPRSGPYLHYSLIHLPQQWDHIYIESFRTDWMCEDFGEFEVSKTKTCYLSGAGLNLTGVFTLVISFILAGVL